MDQRSMDRTIVYALMRNEGGGVTLYYDFGEQEASDVDMRRVVDDEAISEVNKAIFFGTQFPDLIRKNTKLRDKDFDYVVRKVYEIFEGLGFDEHRLENVLEKFFYRLSFGATSENVTPFVALKMLHDDFKKPELAKKIARDRSNFTQPQTYSDIDEARKGTVRSAMHVFDAKAQAVITEYIGGRTTLTLMEYMVLKKPTEIFWSGELTGIISHTPLEELREVLLSPKVTAQKKTKFLETFDFDNTFNAIGKLPAKDRLKLLWDMGTSGRSVSLLHDCMSKFHKILLQDGDHRRHFTQFLNDKENFFHLLRSLQRIIGNKKLEDFGQSIWFSVKCYIPISWKWEGGKSLSNFSIKIDIDEYTEFRSILQYVENYDKEDEILSVIMSEDDRKKVKLIFG
jgi:hypothetical protein